MSQGYSNLVVSSLKNMVAPCSSSNNSFTTRIRYLAFYSLDNPHRISSYHYLFSQTTKGRKNALVGSYYPSFVASLSTIFFNFFLLKVRIPIESYCYGLALIIQNDHRIMTPEWGKTFFFPGKLENLNSQTCLGGGGEGRNGGTRMQPK